MAIGERISFFPQYAGMTQKFFRYAGGLPEKSAMFVLHSTKQGQERPKQI